MAFTMRGLPQYGDEGPKQLGHRLKSIFGKKEEREKYKQYFKDKKAAKKSLKTTGLYGGENITDASVLEGKNLGKSTVKTRREAAKAYAQDKLDGANEIAAVYTTKKVKKKDVKGGANAAAYANVNKGTGVDLDVDFDIKNTKYKKDDSGYVKNYRTENTVTIPGEKKIETFDNVPDAEKRNQELLSTPGILKVKKLEEDGVDMKSGLGFNMRSNIYELSGAKAKLMQSSNIENPNPITTSTEEHKLDFGGGSTVSKSQDKYEVPATEKYEGPKIPKGSEEEKAWAKQRDFCKGKPPGTPGCSGFHKYEGGGSAPGMNESKTNITLEYQTPSTTTTTVDEGSKTVGLGGKTGNKLSIDADVDADAKIKLPKLGIGKAIKTGIDKITGNTEKGRQRRAKRDKIKTIRKGGDVCPPCPPCN